MIISEWNLVFLHPSKTGGTSVEQALCHYLFHAPLSQEERDKYALWTNSSPQHWPLAEILKRRPETASYRQVVTVRHPYARFVSEFNYQASGERYRRHKFEQFYVKPDINGAIRSGALWSCHYPWHGAQQCQYLGATTEIIRMENLAEDWKRTFPDLEPLPHVMKSKKYASVADLNDRSKEEIFKRYKDDFIAFQYER